MDDTLINISIKTTDKDIVYVELHSDKFTTLLYTPLNKADIKNKNIHILSENIRDELVKVFT